MRQEKIVLLHGLKNARYYLNDYHHQQIKSKDFKCLFLFKRTYKKEYKIYY